MKMVQLFLHYLSDLDYPFQHIFQLSFQLYLPSYTAEIQANLFQCLLNTHRLMIFKTIFDNQMNCWLRIIF